MLNRRAQFLRLLTIVCLCWLVLAATTPADMFKRMFGTTAAFAAPNAQLAHCPYFWDIFCERRYLPLIKRDPMIAQRVGPFEVVGQLQEQSRYAGHSRDFNTLLVDGNVAFLQGTYAARSLLTIDVSNPAIPATMNMPQISGGRKLSLQDDMFFGLGSASGITQTLVRTDISDLTHPEPKRDCNLSLRQQTNDLQMVSNRAYISVWSYTPEDNALWIIDFSDTRSDDCPDLRLVNSYRFDGVPYGIFVRDGYAYVTVYPIDYSSDPPVQTSLLYILDVHVPQQMKQVSRIVLPSVGYDIDVRGDIAYVIAHDGTIMLVDVSDIQHPRVVIDNLIPDKVATYTIDGSTLYAASLTGGLKMYDISSISSPRLIAEYRNNNEGVIAGISIKDDLIYIGGTKGLQILRYVAQYNNEAAFRKVQCIPEQD